LNKVIEASNPVDERPHLTVDPRDDRSRGEQDDTMQQLETTTESILLRPIVPNRMDFDDKQNHRPIDAKLQPSSGTTPESTSLHRGADLKKVETEFDGNRVQETSLHHGMDSKKGETNFGGNRVQETKNEESLTPPNPATTSVAIAGTKLTNGLRGDNIKDSAVSVKIENLPPVKEKFFGRKGSRDDYQYKDDDDDVAGVPVKDQIGKPIDDNGVKNAIGDDLANEKKKSRKENGPLHEKRQRLSNDAKLVRRDGKQFERSPFDAKPPGHKPNPSDLENGDKEYDKFNGDGVEAGN